MSLRPARDPHMVSGVSILPHTEAVMKEASGVQVTTLVHAQDQPRTRIIELALADGTASHTDKVAADRWVYNTSSRSARLSWGDGKAATINPDDSAYIAPNTAHTLRSDPENPGSKLVLVDIVPGAGDPLIELWNIAYYAGHEALARVHTETTRWY